MAVYTFNKVRTQQPQRLVSIDSSKLPKAEYVGVGSLGFVNLVKQSASPTFVSSTRKPNRDGVGIEVGATGYIDTKYTGYPSNNSRTIIILFDIPVSGNGYGRVYCKTDTTAEAVLWDGTNFEIHFSSNVFFAPASVGRHCLVLSNKDGRQLVADNGRIIYSGTSSPGYSADTNPIIIGNRVAGDRPAYTNTHLFAVANWSANEQEAISISANPWQIFKPEERFFYTSSGTSGAYTLTASGGTYTVQGASAGIFRSRVLSGTGGSYTLTGGQAVVSRNRKLGASGGTYNYTGQSITITHTGTSNAYTLTAQGGSYALSGGTALILKSKRITSVGGVYTLTGSDAVVLKSKYLTAASGTYSLTGGTATVLKSKMLISTGGVYSYTGSSTVIKKSKYLSALGGSYSLVGSSVVLVHGGIGGIVWPPTHLVVLGTVYGPTGSEYTGTLDVNGIKYDITTGQLVKPISDKVVMSL